MLDLPIRLGVDIGGAFTDLVAFNEETGEITWVKGETTPLNLSEGVINVVKKSKLDLSKLSMFIHGQTLVINSIVTRDGAKVGLLTTKGHRDVLILQRANRRDMYNLRYKKPEPFVPRYLSLEVEERIDGTGNVLIPLNKESVVNAVERLLKEGVESICIGFLNSYLNPKHETEAKKIVLDVLKEHNKDIPVTISSEVTREWREYERINTAVLNAFVKPKMRKYLSVLENEISKLGFKGKFLMVLSNGGMASFDFAKNLPIYTIESGPVAGVMGAVAIAELIGERNIIALDGGSTTTKASLVENLTPKITSDYYVGRDRFHAGYPVKVPTVEIAEVGNGGTSIAWIDSVGNLRVGPKAAGAYPGPACYGKGGKEPTVTDAYVVNRLINPEYLLGGEMKIYRDLAVKVIKEKIADHYNISVEEAADAIVRIANENAANAIRIISVQKGYDPRDFSLIAYGGSGPMFAPFIAEDLEMKKIIIPTVPPGVFSAWGMLLMDIKHDVIISNVMKVEEGNLDKINEVFLEVDSKLYDIFREEENISPENIIIFHYADMRYKGQEHTVKVPIKTGKITAGDLPEIIEKFHEYHEHAYDFRLPGSPVEIVSFHGVGIAKVVKPKLKEIEKTDSKLGDAIVEERKIYVYGEEMEVPVYSRTKIPREAEGFGPAVIEDPTSTVLVLKNQKFLRDRFGNIIIMFQR